MRGACAKTLLGCGLILLLPAGMKLGRETMFFAIIIALGVLGLVLTVSGYFMRGAPDE